MEFYVIPWNFLRQKSGTMELKDFLYNYKIPWN